MTKPSEELLRRAREYCKEHYPTMRSAVPIEMAQFAEQIVRECIEIAAKRGTIVAYNIRKQFEVDKE